MVPAENAGAKLYAWDKHDGYVVNPTRNLYNSYFYPVDDPAYDPVMKMYLQGTDFISNLDGGSAYHCNLDTHLSKKQYRVLMDIAIQAGCSYLTFNIPNTLCNKCGHISKQHLDHCEACGSEDVDWLTRIIGYLKRVGNFSEPRQIEAATRAYYEKEEIND